MVEPRRGVCGKCGHAWEEKPEDRPALEVQLTAGPLDLMMAEAECPACGETGPWVLEEE